MIRRITEVVPRPYRDLIYDLVAQLPAKRLCVDVGAAAGLTTRRIRTTGDSQMQVIAFEPFPGNASLFARETRDLTNVTFVAKAVGSEVGRAAFLVPQVVEGHEKDWENYQGYSSVGFLVDWPSLADWKRDFRRALRDVAKIVLGRLSRRGRWMYVDETTLDKEFPASRLDFLKIDVQGGEEKVLLGATTLLRSGNIPLIYLEWNGHRPVVELLGDCRYIVFDSVYAVFPRGTPLAKFEQLGLERIGELHLSSGQTAYEMILSKGSLSPMAVVDKAREMGLAGIQTDLIAVHDSYFPDFLAAVRRLPAPS